MRRQCIHFVYKLPISAARARAHRPDQADHCRSDLITGQADTGRAETPFLKSVPEGLIGYDQAGSAGSTTDFRP